MAVEIGETYEVGSQVGLRFVLPGTRDEIECAFWDDAFPVNLVVIFTPLPNGRRSIGACRATRVQNWNANPTNGP